MSNAERMRVWRASLTPEQREEQAAKARLRVKAWRKRNGRKNENGSAAALARKARWKKNHPEKVSADTQARNAAKLMAAPAWANDFFVSEAYDLAKIRTRVTGFRWHVDHIVPLRAKMVCGLHCESNLQVIPANDNLKKNNRYWPDMWEAA